MARRDDFQNSNYSQEESRSFDGDARNDRPSQERDWYERNERRRGARAQRRSTQDFETRNANEYNRGREGDQDWRSSDYSPREYREDYAPNVNYAERYGFSGYGRSHYDPDINRGWREDRDLETWRADRPFSDREQDYRGGRWNRESRNYGREDRMPAQTQREYSNSRLRNDPKYYGSWDPRELSTSQQRGPYSGIGPKNYRRTDERIHEEVCDTLMYHSGIDATNIEVKVSEGEVTLCGEIPDRYMKRMVEDAIDEIPGVKNVNNQLRIEQSNRGYMVGSNGNGMMGTGQQRPA